MKTEYRWGLIPRSDLLDLCSEKPDPIAIFACKEAAEGHGKRMYGSYFEIAEVLTVHTEVKIDASQKA